ncbi:MAG: FAD-dependent oxidoreductase [Balneolales bacterium]
MQTSTNSESFWTSNTTKSKEYRALSSHVESDVTIVGGGITGLIAAMQLTIVGKDVVVLESNRLAKSTTGFSTGNLYVPLQNKYSKLIKDFDEETASTIATSRKEAIDFVERTVVENKIDCQFHRRPWYMYTNKAKNVPMLRNEVEAMKKLGLEINYVKDIPLKVPFIEAAKMENQARFNPYKFVTELAEILSRQGCRIYEESPVTRIHEKGKCTAKTPNGMVESEHIIEATHIPKGINMTQTLVYPHRSYVVAVEINEPYPDGNFWDIDKVPAHAISSHGAKSNELEMLMFAGSHHKTGQSDISYNQHYKELEDFIEGTYPGSAIKHHWSAQHYTPADGSPYIGVSSLGSTNRYMATGYSTDGLTYGVIGGVVLSNMITGLNNPWLEPYISTRIKPVTSSKEFVKENINVATQYVKDYLQFGEVEAFSDIDKLEGRTLQINGEKLAAYRDAIGHLHVYSAVCPHMKCIVNWNDAEKSWDCPCHGSRFSIDGRVLEGPALNPLRKIDPSVVMKK